MVPYVRSLIIAALSCGSFSAAFAQPKIYGIGLRGDEAATKKFFDRHRIVPIDSNTVEFDNGNTFVRFEDSLDAKNIVVRVPESLSPDQFMELLIKIRTAKTNSAAQVMVFSDAPSISSIKVVDSKGQQIKGLPVEHLLATAGATNPDLSRKTVSVDRGPSQGEGYITHQNHERLANALAEKAGLKSLPEGKIPKGSQIYLVASQSPPVNENFFKALAKVNDFETKAGAYVHLLTPYLPYARSDKIDQKGVTVTGRLAADLIETSGAREISFVRAHAPQSQGFFSIPSSQSSGRPTITKFLKEAGVEMIISPDAGFQKDATLYADDLGLPVAVVNKQRDPVTGKSSLKGFSGDGVRGKRVAIIDDETASGGTLGKVAELLKNEGAEDVYAVVTHITGSGKGAVESPHIKQLLVTETMTSDVSDPKVKVLSIADELAENIRAAEVARHQPRISCDVLWGRVKKWSKVQ